MGGNLHEAGVKKIRAINILFITVSVLELFCFFFMSGSRDETQVEILQ